MKHQRFITTAIAMVGVLSFVCLIGYYLALHDIFRDYVSPKVLQEQTGLTEASLPEWTECSQEWRFVQVSFWPMLAFHVLILISLVWCTRRNIHDLPNT